MSAPPLVSVVIPLYNKRETIGRALDSILAQYFTDFEIIVIDDGSSDESSKYIEDNYKDSSIQIRRQNNAGPGAARNAGLEICRGEFVTFLDADDEWLPGFLSSAVAELERYPDCAAFTSAYILEPEGIDRWSKMADAPLEGPWKLQSNISRRELSTCIGAFHACSAVYRTNIVRNLGGFYAEERCTFGEDIYLWIQILLNFPIYRRPAPLARYHMEDSALGLAGRGGPVPIEPVFTAAQRIRASCPPPLRQVFELWLGKHAVQAAFVQLERGATEQAKWLIETFPGVKLWRWDYARIRIRIAYPKLWWRLQRLRGKSVPVFPESAAR